MRGAEVAADEEVDFFVRAFLATGTAAFELAVIVFDFRLIPLVVGAGREFSFTAFMFSIAFASSLGASELLLLDIGLLTLRATGKDTFGLADLSTRECISLGIVRVESPL